MDAGSIQENKVIAFIPMLSRLFGKKSRVKRDHDRVWKTETLKLNGITSHASWLDRHATRVLLITHFRHTYRALESLLHSRATPYTPVVSAVDAARLLDPASIQPGRMILMHADLLPTHRIKEVAARRECGFEIVLIVAEHYPLPSEDDRILEFARSLPCTVRLCYHESLDAALIKRFGGDQVSRIMTALHTPENEAITHASVDKAIRAAQEKLARQIETNRPADTAGQWFLNNMPRD